MAWNTPLEASRRQTDDTNDARTSRLAGKQSTTEEAKISPVLAGVKPLFSQADDQGDNDSLPHPHAGARFEDGTLGLVVDPDPARLSRDDDDDSL